MKKEQQEMTTFDKLKAKLPKGFSNIVVDRLAEKQVKVSARTVQYVANGRHRNPQIEAELLKLLDEKIESDFEIEIKKRLEKFD